MIPSRKQRLIMQEDAKRNEEDHDFKFNRSKHLYKLLLYILAET